MKLDPYLIYQGQAEEAIAFYGVALGLEHGEINRYKDSPMPHTAAQKNWIMHCELLDQGRCIAMVADTTEVNSGNQIQLSLNYKAADLEKMKIAFDQLAEGGKITQPLEKQFWNATFGQLIDRFGIHWMMNCNHETT